MKRSCFTDRARCLIEEKRLRQQAGFTLVELMLSMSVLLMIALGAQAFVITSMLSMNRQTKTELAEDVAEIVNNQLSKNAQNFSILNSVLEMNPAHYATSPLTIPVYTTNSLPTSGWTTAGGTTSPLVNSLFSSSEQAVISQEAKKLHHAEVDVFAAPTKMTLGDGTVIFSPNKIIVGTRVKWKYSPQSEKFQQVSVSRVLSRDYNQ